MSRPSRGNVQCIRAQTLPTVLEMPSWSVRAERRRPKVLQMPARGMHAEQRRPVVLQMPAQPAAAWDSAAGPLDAENDAELREALSRTEDTLQPDSAAVYCGLRFTVLALMALFGRPHPTRDNDPGPASAARPWKPRKVELLSAVTRPRMLVSHHQDGDSLAYPAAELARAA